jgi:hypothetical protein
MMGIGSGSLNPAPGFAIRLSSTTINAFPAAVGRNQPGVAVSAKTQATTGSIPAKLQAIQTSEFLSASIAIRGLAELARRTRSGSQNLVRQLWPVDRPGQLQRADEGREQGKRSTLPIFQL